jgi:hypothetical protein
MTSDHRVAGSSPAGCKVSLKSRCGMNEKCVRENINAEFQLLVKSRDILAAQDADDIDDLLQVRLICLLPPNRGAR